MRSLGVVEDQIVSQSFMEKRFVVDDVKMVIDELFLNGAVVAFDVGIDFRAMGIREEVRDAIGFQLVVELAQVFRSVVRLPMGNRGRIDLFKTEVEIFHVTTGEPFVIEGQDELGSGVNGAQEIVFDSVGESLYGV